MCKKNVLSLQLGGESPIEIFPMLMYWYLEAREKLGDFLSHSNLFI